MTFLKTANAGPVSIKKLIHALNGGMEEARANEEIHASDLTNEEREFCPRERVLLLRTEKAMPARMINTAMRLTFDLGNATQSLLNNRWLRDRMFGEWRCSRCHASWWGVGLIECPDCETPSLTYIEMQFEYSAIKRFTGSLDAVVDVGADQHLMVEVKIIDKDYFKALKAPMSEHATRTKLYLKLIAESTHPYKDQINTQEARLLYIMRGYGIKGDGEEISPFKEYTIKRNDADVNYMIELARQANLGFAGGDIPQGICSNVTCKRAKNCPVRVECFSGDWG